jgi:hypothetical protein
LGKERIPLFCGAEKLMGESLRKALLSTSGMKGSLLFEQASSRKGSCLGTGLHSWALQLSASLKHPSALLLQSVFF